MSEEIEKPKKKRRSKKETVRESETIESEVSDEPIEIENVETFLLPELLMDREDESGDMGREVGLIIPEDKMSHRNIAMQCNSCFVADSCPQYKEDSDCTIDWGRLFRGEFTPTDLLQSSVAILDLQLMRINRAFHMEKLNQGILDPELTRNLQIYFEMLQTFKKLSERDQPSISITAKGDATKGGGVLSQLLGLK